MGEQELNLRSLRETPPWEWPQDAAARLLAVLRDSQAEEVDRLLAVEMAGDITVINDVLVQALLAILKNTSASDELRGKAAISLGPVLELADIDEFGELSDTPITEDTFLRTQKSLRNLYSDTSLPKGVRRRILEASIRAPQGWHYDAIRAAYASSDDDWKLTAVFSMRWVRGFDDQILEALNSANDEIRYEAVHAVGEWEIDAAWSHVTSLLAAGNTDKGMLLAAINAVATIRPEEAVMVLVELTESDDKDIAAAAREAVAMADGLSGEDWEEKDE